MNNNYYSAPHKGFPEELPTYWRFEDGTVRTDLRMLPDEELAALGWVGPIRFLTPGEDYNPETHKAVWYAAERKFVVVDINTNPKPYASGELLTYDDVPADWDTFKRTAIASPALNTYVASVMSVAPLAATALPATLIKIENNSYGDFKTTWQAMNTFVPIPEELHQEIVGLAQSCHLPLKFIAIISGTDIGTSNNVVTETVVEETVPEVTEEITPETPETVVEETVPEVVEETVVPEVTETEEKIRARDESGQFIPDDPNTPDVNEAWVNG